MKTDVDKMLEKHEQLTHSEGMKVVSHTQREEGDWVLQTLMIEGCSAPFKYKRTKRFRSLEGQKVNLTYYPSTQTVAGFDVEVMNVVRVKRF
ncbi:hypothetical protein [Shewanella gelidii]|uniref:Uncharacterized protein n=1 Tax=Shewanella gelidii TaxID=1642821 RepID=A0A917JT00_9GAMM|nr:hypothetical protein [Shewanella gelidii]MCL1098000.1 hypothetical protein [Shewanella gelidii]GGI85342.1 hypothetical protein GCM10009332_23320 [Shewanella gelidii]